MELKVFIKVLREYKKTLLIAFIVGALIGGCLTFFPKRYISSGNLYVSRSIDNKQAEFFTYEGYYGQQTAQSYANTVLAMLESLDIKSLALQKLDLSVNARNIRKLNKQMKIKKPGPQLISLEIKGNTEKEVRNLWGALSKSLVETTTKVNLRGDSNLMVETLSNSPIVKEVYWPLPIFSLAGGLIATALAVSIISLKKYLS